MTPMARVLPNEDKDRDSKTIFTQINHPSMVVPSSMVPSSMVPSSMVRSSKDSKNYNSALVSP